MSMDLINAAFELGGTVLMMVTLVHAWRVGVVMGVHLATPLFFWGWGAWNVLYYPSLGQTWSFIAGVLLCLTNTVWVFTVWKLTPRDLT